MHLSWRNFSENNSNRRFFKQIFLTKSKQLILCDLKKANINSKEQNPEKFLGFSEFVGKKLWFGQNASKNLQKAFVQLFAWVAKHFCSDSENA
jgi:hypothetical protein